MDVTLGVQVPILRTLSFCISRELSTIAVWAEYSSVRYLDFLGYAYQRAYCCLRALYVLSASCQGYICI